MSIFANAIEVFQLGLWALSEFVRPFLGRCACNMRRARRVGIARVKAHCRDASCELRSKQLFRLVMAFIFDHFWMSHTLALSPWRWHASGKMRDRTMRATHVGMDRAHELRQLLSQIVVEDLKA